MKGSIRVVKVAALTSLAALSIAASAAGETAVPSASGGLKENGLIAFDSVGDIWVSSEDGSSRSQLTSGPAFDISPMWSPDGTRIAYWSVAPTDDAGPFDYDTFMLAASEPRTSLMVMAADGSDAHALVEGLRLVDPTAPEPPEVRARWSPDGESILYSQFADGGSRVEVVAATGGIPAILADHGGQPSWSPDGPMIAYLGEDDPKGAIHLMAADGSEQHELTSVQDGQGEPEWSPDGTRILFHTGSGGTADIWVANVDGTGDAPLIASSANEFHAVWAPDGSRIVFDRARSPEDSSVVGFVVSTADGTGEITLDHPAVWGTVPTWSPDGTKVFGYSAEPDLTAMTLVIADASGVQPATSIPASGNLGLGSWQAIQE
jgi:TolB protein